ncbi:MAG: hypothetical protein J7577_15465 [Sphingobacteriaceae bacterium]|nr:hypothetical protein [Sphingobacteriaceae bacterium]
MTKTLYIASLHRPFNQQLKTSKWVCNFIGTSKKKIPSSVLIPEFYYHLIQKVNKEYQKNVPKNFNGLPSDSAIKNISEFILNRTKKEFMEELPQIVKSRKSAIEKQIYSTYKAASYYVNLAKDKFGLINDKNQLTETGKELLNIRSGFFKISNTEANFYFLRIIEADFHLFMTHCFFLKLQNKHKNEIDDFVKLQIEFINQYLGIKHFNFTNSSIGNYNVVRQSWVESLNVTDDNSNIRKRYLQIIEQHDNFGPMFSELKSLFKLFEKENFKAKSSYLARKNKFLALYSHNLKTSHADQGFVNLYDIKAEMKMSLPNFQNFLVNFYEDEKNLRNIYFSNPVTSIDRRERFFIRNRPVLKIKIK